MYACLYLYVPVCVLLTMFKPDKIQNKFKLVDPILIFKVGKGVCWIKKSWNRQRTVQKSHKKPQITIMNTCKLPQLANTVAYSTKMSTMIALSYTNNKGKGLHFWSDSKIYLKQIWGFSKYKSKYAQIKKQ